MKNLNDLLVEITHMAFGGVSADDPEVKRQVLSDIYDAIASAMPVDHHLAPVTDGAGESAGKGAAVNGMNRFLRISDRLQLRRFRGPDFVKLVGRVAAHDSQPPHIYEIFAEKGGGQHATCYRDEKILFEIESTCPNMTEKMAISALHRWWDEAQAANRRRHKSRKAKRAAKRAAKQEGTL